MSAITDAVRLLNEESAAFSLLPAINYFYFYLKLSDPGLKSNVVILVAIFLSAIWFNILSTVQFGSYTGAGTDNTDNESSESDDEHLIDSISLVVILSAAILWLLSFTGSLISLKKLFGESAIWPELLAGISILFVCLVTSDLLLTGLLPVYNEED